MQAPDHLAGGSEKQAGPFAVPPVRDSEGGSVSTALAKILVVDDNAMNREMLSRRLGKQGYEACSAPDGQAALDLIEAGGVDLVLLDIMMPGIDGFETLARIRESRSPFDLPVIMATAKDEGDDIVRALDMGANDYVTKPFDYTVLKARVTTQVNLKLAHEQLKESHSRMANDLEAAARIQASLLPRKGPEVSGFRFNWQYRPCDELAGDALNVQRLDNGRIVFYLVDVSGHGVPAALLSVSVVHRLHPAPGPSSLIWRPGEAGEGLKLRSPSQVVNRLNSLYPIQDHGGLYFTMIYGLLDPETGDLSLVVAGHPRPILARADGRAEATGKPNPPVGMVPDVDYVESRCRLGLGDRLLFYSDGLTEVYGPEDEMFGDERLVDAMGEIRSIGLADVPGALADYVLGWSGTDKFEDDLSILVLESQLDGLA